MAFVVAAIWRAKEGQEAVIADVLEQLAPLSREEPKMLQYIVHRSPDDARTFFLYEQYTDRSGYEDHLATPHFEQLARGIAIPNLESRERAFYETWDV